MNRPKNFSKIKKNVFKSKISTSAAATLQKKINSCPLYPSKYGENPWLGFLGILQIKGDQEFQLVSEHQKTFAKYRSVSELKIKINRIASSKPNV